MIRFAPVWFAFSLLLTSSLCLGQDSWPQWRGPGQVGVAPAGQYPQKWSLTEKQNIAWQAEIPGRGGSTPVIWGQRAYLTSGDQGNNTLWGLNLQDGKIAWSCPLGKDAGGKHAKGSGSNPSVVTDGKHLFAYFRSGDLACVDMQGKPVWTISVPEQLGLSFDLKTLWWDLGTSPVLTKDAVVIAIMHSGPSYVAAFDQSTGKVKWKQDRSLNAPEEAAQSYSTPIVTQYGGEEIVLVLGADHLTCHKGATGEEMWRVGGFNPKAERFFRSIASPVLCDDIVVCPYSRGNTLTAVRLKDHQIVWSRDDFGADVPTPVAYQGKVFVLNDKGKFECLDSNTGKTLWSGEFPKSRKGFTSSPLLAGNHLYMTREDGTTYVIDAKEPFTIVSENKVNEPETPLVASLVPVQKGFLIRSGNQLTRVGE